MDELRKGFLVAGLYLGDINLALASVARQLPTYVKGVDPNSLVEEDQEIEAVRREVENWLSDRDRTELDEQMVERILDRAIANGRYLSAIRCLEMLGKREAYVSDYIRKGEEALQGDDFQGAARAFVIASSLDLNEGLPLFQYSGPELHQECTLHPENCITRKSLEQALPQALFYLLGSRTVSEEVESRSSEIQAQLFPWIVLERDPHAAEFYRNFEQAHAEIENVVNEKLRELGKRIKGTASAVRDFKSDLGSLTATAPVVGKIRRIADGLASDFEAIEDLLRGWQLLRLQRRLERLIEFGHDVAEASERVKESGFRNAARRLLDAVEGIEQEDLVGGVQEIQRNLLDAQARMLGRKVASQEHWQFLREISFKYPVAPLTCCLRHLNDQWLVVPVWESPLVDVVRDHLKVISG